MPYAYVAAYVEDSCTIIDVTTPVTPTYTGHIAGVAAPNFLNYAAEIYVLGDYAYIGALLDNSLTIINVSNPAAPAYAGHIAGTGGPIYLHEARGIFVRRVGGNILAYVVSSPEDTFSIFDVTNPAVITLLGSVTGVGFPNYLHDPHDIVVEGDYAYIASNADVAVPIFNVSDPTNPTISAVARGIPFGLTAGPYGIAWNNNHIYVVCSGATGPLSVIDVTDPTTPVYRGNTNHANLNGSSRVFIDGTHAYVAALTEDLLTIIDISNPAAPAWAAAIGGAGPPNWLNGPQGVFVADGVAHVAATYDDSVSLFDVSTPAAPALLGNIRGAAGPNFLNGAWGIAPYVNPSTVPTVQTDPATEIT